ncbi:MAG TPA: heme lyase CcmF/NrfE family subunit [Dongiaceae bacterium]|jgi:cytochrome c-type biogenesis protein CcmF|nr:heme lyase CcmF/NrfE family subunit [Dongiaceae bacterium]
MIPELGHYALVLALVMALAQASLPMVGAARGTRPWMQLAKPAALAQFGFVAFAFLALMQAFATSDFSVAIVTQHSHSQQPLIYKLSGTWGNHEGSLLLWVLILTIFGALVALFGENLPPRLKARTLSVQAMISIGFILFMLFTSNPFARLNPAPLEGDELNPLLQDPGLAMHPPMLYLGYVGFSIVFSFAVAALIDGKVDAAWARWVRPWCLLSWTCLTGGIVLGSWWAYNELGWGGWWFWDPVENASFMPWLIGTALLHSALVVEKRGALKSWTILLSILTFGFSLLGTFLVRSGIITSVHAFADDPTRGVFILALLTIAIGAPLTLFALRAPTMRGGGLFAPLSREGALVMNNLLLATMCATVLLGTLYPLLLELTTGGTVSVGMPFYGATFVPLALPLLLLMAVGPFMGWKRGDVRGALQRLIAAGIAAFGAAVIAIWMKTDGPILAPLGLAAGVWLLIGTAIEFMERIHLFEGNAARIWTRARHMPRAAYGMSLAHFGLAVAIIGMTGAAAWKTEEIKVLQPGQSLSLQGYDFKLESVGGIRGDNYLADQAHFIVSADGEFIADLYPERRQYLVQPMPTTEAAIRSTPLADLYAVIGEPDGKGGWIVRVYHEPLVSWIWFGALIMVAGGLTSLSDRRYRVGAPVRAGATQVAKA